MQIKFFAKDNEGKEYKIISDSSLFKDYNRVYIYDIEGELLDEITFKVKDLYGRKT
jgi:hypothetical protein